MPPSLIRERHHAKRLALYSHKGGVGKTTLTVNLAFALAEKRQSVLLVDTDPQCNMSAYLLDSDYLDRLLDNSDKETGQTIWTMLRLVESAKSVEPRLINPMDLPHGVALVPGDIKLSDLEEALSYDWRAAKRRDIEGFAAVTSVSLAINSLCASKDIDFIFYDCGPNIGALNRCILLDCDYFLVPTACDEFSIRALSTLGASISKWLTEWSDIADLAPDGTYLPPGRPQFLGYILQQFKVYGGAIASGPASFLPKIDRHVQEDIVAVLKSTHPETIDARHHNYKFGQLQDLSGLVSTGQTRGVPLWEVVGGPDNLKHAAKASFFEMADRLISLAGRTKS